MIHINFEKLLRARQYELEKQIRHCDEMLNTSKFQTEQLKYAYEDHKGILVMELERCILELSEFYLNKERERNEYQAKQLEPKKKWWQKLF